MANPPTRRQILGSAAGLAAWSMAPTWSREWRVVAQESPVPPAASRVAHFESLAFGLLAHWGLYSLLGKGERAKLSESLSTAEYMGLMGDFKARDFSGRELARTARRAGMGYVTLTARHHDGFSLFDTKGLSPYDVTHTAAGRDLVADFVGGCRAEGVLPMLYVSTLDWSDPRFDGDWHAYLSGLRASLELLCTAYGPIAGFWFDGTWSKPEADWELDALYAVIRARQPEALIIENAGPGQGAQVRHPEVDSTTSEHRLPQQLDRRGHAKYVAVEMLQTFNHHTGLAERDFNQLSPAHVIETLSTCRGNGANLLMNIGASAAGAVPDFERAALARVGDWITLQGGRQGPLYLARPCGLVGDQRDFGLLQGQAYYLFVFDLTATADSRPDAPARGPGARVFRGLPGSVRRVTWLDSGEELQFEQQGNRLTVQATGYPHGTDTVVRLARVEV